MKDQAIWASRIVASRHLGHEVRNVTLGLFVLSCRMQPVPRSPGPVGCINPPRYSWTTFAASAGLWSNIPGTFAQGSRTLYQEKFYVSL